jgi:hypothetical protein
LTQGDVKNDPLRLAVPVRRERSCERSGPW